MSIINDLMTALGTILDSIVSFFSGLLSDVIGVIWTAGEGSASGTFTTFGYLFLLGVGLGLFWFIFGWIRRLLTFRARN